MERERDVGSMAETDGIAVLDTRLDNEEELAAANV